MKIRLLLVEDNKPDQEVWTQLLEKHEANAERTADPTFALTIASTVEEAKALIEVQDFDAAIVDLRLATAAVDGMDSSGNEIIALLLKTEMAAVAAFTGEPGSVEIPEHAKSLVRVFTKGADEGEGPEVVLAWLVGQTPMNIAIRKAETIIKGEMANFFVRSIWPRWNNWLGTDVSDDQEFLATAVARHLTSHVYAALLDKYKQKAHPEEWFVVPPIHSGVRTGDIIRTAAHGFEIVVTPRCDLATGKRKTLQLATCTDVSEDWNTLVNRRVELQKQVEEM